MTISTYLTCPTCPTFYRTGSLSAAAAGDWSGVRPRPLLHLVIDSGLEQLGRVSATVEPVLRELWTDPLAADRVGLAVHEVVANAIRHGNHDIPRATVEITLRTDHDDLIVEISDQGPGFDPAAVPDPRRPDTLPRPCGRGMLLVHAAVTNVEATRFSAGRFVLTLRATLPRTSAGDTPATPPSDARAAPSNWSR